MSRARERMSGASSATRIVSMGDLSAGQLMKASGRDRGPWVAAGRRSSRPPPLLELARHHRGAAVRADAVAEGGVGVLADVALQLFPRVLVVADLLAVGADRQHALQARDLGQRPLGGLARGALGGVQRGVADGQRRLGAEALEQTLVLGIELKRLAAGDGAPARRP